MCLFIPITSTHAPLLYGAYVIGKDDRCEVGV